MRWIVMVALLFVLAGCGIPQQGTCEVEWQVVADGLGGDGYFEWVCEW